MGGLPICSPRIGLRLLLPPYGRFPEILIPCTEILLFGEAGELVVVENVGL